VKPYQKETKPRHSYFNVHHATVGTSQEASGSRSSTLSPTTSSSATAQEPSRTKEQEECIQKALGFTVGERIVHDHDSGEDWQSRAVSQASRGSSTAQVLCDLW